MEKSPIFLGAVGNVDGHTGLSLALNRDHSRQRRALGYLFTNSALRHLENLMQVHIKKWISVLGDAADERKPLDFANWCKHTSINGPHILSVFSVIDERTKDTYLAFDVMGDLCFAEPFGCLDEASGTEWSTSVINVFVSATYTQAIRRISGVGTWLESFLTWLLVPSSAAAWRKLHLSKSKEKVLQRLTDRDRDHTDFIYHIMQHNESRQSLSETEIILNVALFISAGTDTTATALTGWTYFVCTHPEVYSRLLTEVRSAVTSHDEITWDIVKGLQYLEATLNEALRLFPPSPASQQRVVPLGGATIDGYTVPAGTTVAVSPWSSTHSSLNFHEPDSFIPERWLDEDVRFKLDRLEASLPFGTGPRVCIGRNLAYMEMRLIAAHLLWNFDLSLDMATYKLQNGVWGLDGRMNDMKVFHSMTKPELWVLLRSRRRKASFENS